MCIVYFWELCFVNVLEFTYNTIIFNELDLIVGLIARLRKFSFYHFDHKKKFQFQVRLGYFNTNFDLG